jgi:hypothetical protein
MKKKLIGAILAVSVVATVIVSILAYNFFCPIPFKYECTLLYTHFPEGSNSTLTDTAFQLYFMGQPGELFRQVLRVDYLTRDGAYRTITNPDGPTYLKDFQPGSDIAWGYFGPDIEVFYFSDTTKLESIKIEAYGYRWPSLI